MSRRDYVPVIGLVGGVGSGKTAVAEWLGRRRPVVIVDGDAAGHEVLKKSETREKIRNRFGEAVFDRSGRVDRKALASRVFGRSAEEQRARRDLEQIVHPEIRKELVRQIEAARSAAEREVILLDAAVLLEAGWDDLCDAVIFVDTPEAQRLRRAVQSRGWDEKTLRDREASQRTLQQKRSACQAAIDNSRSLDEAGAQLEHLLNEIIARKGRDAS